MTDIIEKGYDILLPDAVLRGHLVTMVDLVEPRVICTCPKQ